MTEEARTIVGKLRCAETELKEVGAAYFEEDDFGSAADLIESLSAQLDQVTRERDAAVRDMTLGRICATCRHHNNSATSKCAGCLSWHSNWQCSGVEVEG